ncbi:upstream-binding factor 1-like protein 1 [Pongo abelii]|uniref:upstream-binding factor 1-like protein 1 n=1 Tax=Pongo abelii TaxID=9601 RepID=UPI000273D9A8|nr:upstream-binding factor 1-like protein 1 [Pongo abelii]
MALPRSQGHWSNTDLLRLLECMQNNLPSDDNSTFSSTQSHMDWGKVAFKNFSGEMCRLKWLEISCNLRKFSTFKELVLETKKCVKKMNKSQKCRNHPDFPKRPLTAYNRFFKESWPQYSQMYPGKRSQELTKILSKKYKELPEQMKQKYIQDFQKEKQEFEEKLARFREEHPDFVQKSKKSGVSKRTQIKVQKKVQKNVEEVRSLPKTDQFFKKVKFHGEPQKPPMNGYHKFHQDSWSSKELQHLSMRERMVEIGRRWQRIPQSQKDHLKSQAEELQKQYKVKLDLWLKTLSPENYAAYKESTYAKGKNMAITGGLDTRLKQADPQSSSAKGLQEGFGDGQGLQPARTDSSQTSWVNCHVSMEPEENRKKDAEEEESSNSSDCSSGEEMEVDV